MKKLLVLFIITLPFLVRSQAEAPVVTKEKLKVVIQLTSGDEKVHEGLMKQINNFLTAAPNSKIEVVCHNNGLSLFTSAVTKEESKVRMYAERGVDFVACENTMRTRNISREELLSCIRTVPAGMVEIVQKQNKKWAYIKAGN